MDNLLKDYMDVLEVETEQDGFGSLTETWTDKLNGIKCRFCLPNIKQSYLDQRIGFSYDYQVFCRDVDIDKRNRIKFENEIFEIVGGPNKMAGFSNINHLEIFVSKVEDK